jgi:hypothetical protein
MQNCINCVLFTIFPQSFEMMRTRYCFTDNFVWFYLYWRAELKKNFYIKYRFLIHTHNSRPQKFQHNSDQTLKLSILINTALFLKQQIFVIKFILVEAQSTIFWNMLTKNRNMIITQPNKKQVIFFPQVFFNFLS